MKNYRKEAYMTNNLNVAATAGLDKSRSIAQINQDIQKSKHSLKSLNYRRHLKRENPFPKYRAK